MSAQRRHRHQWSGHFPGDPRYATNILKATASEFSCLGKHVFLSTAVLDCIIQLTALLPDSSEVFPPPMIGSLGCEAWILSSNECAVCITEKNVKKKNLRDQFAGMLIPSLPINISQRLIVPVVTCSHFFVVSFDFSLTVSATDPYFFKEISVYDSLENATTKVSRRALR